MGKGKDYELTLKNEVMEDTAEEVAAFRPDFSGNSRFSVADVIVVWPAATVEQTICGAFVESKKRSGDEGKRKVVMSGSKSGQSGKEELEELVEGTPPWADPYLMIKFDHREAIILDAAELYVHLQDYSAEMYSLDAYNHGARLTPSDNISMVKPTLDEWHSSTAGQDDHRKLLAEVGVDAEWTSSQPFEIDVSAAASA